jgi:hypothetical protein
MSDSSRETPRTRMRASPRRGRTSLVPRTQVPRSPGPRGRWPGHSGFGGFGGTVQPSTLTPRRVPRTGSTSSELSRSPSAPPLRTRGPEGRSGGANCRAERRSIRLRPHPSRGRAYGDARSVPLTAPRSARQLGSGGPPVHAKHLGGLDVGLPVRGTESRGRLERNRVQRALGQRRSLGGRRLR